MVNCNHGCDEMINPIRGCFVILIPTVVFIKSKLMQIMVESSLFTDHIILNRKFGSIMIYFWKGMITILTIKI